MRTILRQEGSALGVGRWRAGALSILGLMLIGGAAVAGDPGWPQYRGPSGDGKTEESVSVWAGEGPKALWRVATPEGFSSFVVAGGRAYTLVGREVEGARREVCLALDVGNGKELWAAPVGIAKYDGGGDSGTRDNKGGDGPRSTPSVDGNRVYVMSAQLVLACLDAATGKSVWSRDLMKEFGGRNITWQNAASPLVEGDLVFVAGGGAGQSLIAFGKQDGQVAWKAHDEKMTHATPVAATILGQRQVIYFTQSGLVAVKPGDGALLWRHPFRYSTSTAASPVVSGEIVYCAAGYGVGAGAVRVSREGDAMKATEIWRSTGNQPVANHWSTPVAHDGHLYGMFSFKEYGSGPLKCVELATGKVVWEKPGFGAGNVILAGRHLVALSDDGQVVLVEATSKAYTELARAKVVAGKCWSTPVLDEGRLYVRSTKEAVALDVGQRRSSLR